MFGSLCRLGEDSIEKRVARRQLRVKRFESNSLFTAVCKLFLYHLCGKYSFVKVSVEVPRSQAC